MISDFLIIIAKININIKFINKINFNGNMVNFRYLLYNFIGFKMTKYVKLVGTSDENLKEIIRYMEKTK